MSNLARWFRKNYSYLVAVILLIVLLCVSVYNLLWLDILGNKDKALAVTFSVIGVLLTLFQFAYNQIAAHKKKYFDLRFAFYKDLIKQMQGISAIVQEGMLSAVSASDTMHKLMSAVNELKTAIKANEAILFPSLLEKEAANLMAQYIDELLVRTSKCHVSVFNDDSESNRFIESLNWHNAIRDILTKYHEQQHIFLSVVREYL